MTDTLPSLIQQRYRYLQDLGEGGMGRVVLVEDVETSHQRALKWVPATLPPSRAQERHLREFKILSQFQHPHVLQVFDFGRPGPSIGQFFTCEYLAGGSLDKLIGSLTHAESLEIVVQILRALAFLHNQGWVHGDLKPANVMLRNPMGDGELESCLVDFGLAYEEGRPAEEKILGTVHYMPPERILGGRMDRQGDLYSLGVLMYRLWTGTFPFNGEDKVAVLEGHVHHAPADPRDHTGDLQEELALLVLDLLAKKPVERPESADLVLRRMNECCGVPKTLETPETLSSYVRGRQWSGWEGALEEVELLAPVVIHDRLAENSRDIPLSSMVHRPSERPKPSLVLLRNDADVDLDSILDTLARRLQVCGLPTIRLDFNRTPFPLAALLTDMLRILPAPILRDDPNYRRIRFLLGDEQDDHQRRMRRVLRWMGKVASQVPFAVLSGRIEDWGEHFCEFLSAVEEQRHSIPGLRNILWIAHHGPTLPLAQACWARQPQIVEWSQTISLNALDPESLSRWLDQRLPRWVPSEEFLYLLEEESSGNPALLERILISFIEDGRLKRTWDGWEHEDVASDTITPLVQRTADTYRDLPSEERACLDALVVLGGSGDPVWLSQVLSCDEKQLSKTLKKLRRGGWVDQELSGTRHCFRTSYQQKAVRVAIAEEDWVRGNAKVAEWLTDSESAGKRVDPERLATHLLHAGEVERALPYGRAAVKNAVQQGRVLVGIRWLERLLEQKGVVPALLRVEFLKELGDLRSAWGPGSKVRQLRQEALDLYRQERGNDPRGAVLQINLAQALIVLGNFKEAVELVNEALQGLDQKRHPMACRQALLCLAEMGIRRGTVDEVKDIWRALRGLPTPEKGRLLGWEFFLRMSYFEALGMDEKVREMGTQAIRTLRNVKSRGAVTWETFIDAYLADFTGDWTRAQRGFQKAAQYFSQGRNTIQQARCLLFLGERQIDVGQYAAADDYLKRAESLIFRIGARLEIPRLRAAQGRVRALQGWLKDAQDYFVEVRDWGKQFPKSIWSHEANLAKAELHTRCGRVGSGRQLLEVSAHPTRSPGRARALHWLRWGISAMELARKSGKPLECRNVFGETFHNLRELSAGPYETPLWIEHWKNLQHFACEREAAAAEEKIRFLVSNYPFFQPLWQVAQHKLTEEELRKQSSAEELAYYYRQLSLKAFRAGEASRGVFFLDEAQHFARRARTYPLDNLNACRLSIVKANAPDSRAKPENMIQKTWQGLIRSGIFEGRIEMLVLWAWERERQGDSAASQRLWHSAERLFDRWRSTIPWPCNEAILRERCGLERESWVLAPVQNLER